MKRLIIGLGSGRSGTTSLARFLDSQKDAYVVHESAYNLPLTLKFTSGKWLPWEFDEAKYQEWQEGLLTAAGDAYFYGDVALSLLPYVPRIIKDYPEVKFICLKRPRGDVVTSYLVKTQGVNHWYLHDGKRWAKDHWDPMYPKLDEPNKKRAIKKYWDMYYETSAELEKKYPNNFKVFFMKELNTREGRNRILAFAGIPEEERVLTGSFKANKSVPARIIVFGRHIWNSLFPVR